MKNYYNENLEFLYTKQTAVLNIFYTSLKKQINDYTSNFCLDQTEVKEYYRTKYNEVLNLFNSEFKGNIELLFNLEFENDEVRIEKDSFKKFAKLYLKIPFYESLEIIEESILNNDPELLEDNLQFFYNDLLILNAENFLKISLHLKYFKYLLIEDKESNKHLVTKKDLPSFDLYQRYLVLDKKTNIITDILKQDISTTGKHKLLAIFMNCSIDNAKHLLNNTYHNKLQNVDNKKDEVNQFIKHLK